jgi:biopolymer transport protein ExbB
MNGVSSMGAGSGFARKCHGSVVGAIVLAASASTATAQQSEPAGSVAHLPHDLSPWGMFLSADIVVQGVMIGLFVASIITWTVGLAKSLELIVATRRLRQALRRIGSKVAAAWPAP